MDSRSWSPLLLTLFLFSCNSVYYPVAAVYQDYRIKDSLPQDEQVLSMLSSYRDSLEGQMNQVVGNLAITLTHDTPEGSLGDFVADAMLSGAKRYFGNVDAALVNSGGVRIRELTAGDITVGKIYELMPFDNQVVVQALPGSVLKQFLDHTVSRGGWPMAGIKMTIENGKASDVLINGEKLDLARTYLIANTDYVAKGGDNSVMLKALPRQQKQYLFRDAIIDYVSQYRKLNKKVPLPESGRISHAQ